MTQYLEITAVVLGLVQGVLVMFNRRSNWIFYCLQMTALVLFSWRSKLYGDVAIDAFYFLLGVFSFVLWGRTRAKNITVTPIKGIIGYCIGVVCMSVVLYFCLNCTYDVLPILDSLTTATSLFATILMALRRLDCWLVWFVNDTLYCIEYYLLPDQALYLFGLNIIWSIMAVLSFFKWRKLYLREYL